MLGKRVELHLSEEALQDIEAIFAWYESQAAWRASENVLMTILDSIESLVDHPEVGTVGASGNRERVISTVPYRIVYLFDAARGRVTVHAVVHTRRRWPSGIE